MNITNIRKCSGSTSLGADLSERFNRTIKDLPEKFVLEKGENKWVDLLPAITRQ